MPAWAMIFVWALFCAFSAWVGSRWSRSARAILRDERDLARREADHLRASRDEWEQLARDAIARNRTLRHHGRRVPEEKN